MQKFLEGEFTGGWISAGGGPNAGNCRCCSGIGGYGKKADEATGVEGLAGVDVWIGGVGMSVDIAGNCEGWETGAETAG